MGLHKTKEKKDSVIVTGADVQVNDQNVNMQQESLLNDISHKSNAQPLMRQQDLSRQEQAPRNASHQLNMQGISSISKSSIMEGFLQDSYYAQRTDSMITSLHEKLLETQWKDGDSNSMQAVKNLVKMSDDFHSQSILDPDQIEKIKSIENWDEAMEYAVKAMEDSLQRYRDINRELSEKCDDYIAHHNPYTKKGKSRLADVKSIKLMAIEDVQNFETQVRSFLSDKNLSKSNLLTTIVTGQTWESVISKYRINDVNDAFDAVEMDEPDYIDTDINIDTDTVVYDKASLDPLRDQREQEEQADQREQEEQADQKEQEDHKEREDHKEQEDHKALKIDSLEEKQEEVSREVKAAIEHEDEIEVQDKTDEVFIIHIPGGDLLHEKYPSQKEDMKFEKNSYYAQRGLLTETELDMEKNLNGFSDSLELNEIKENIEKLHNFHTSPVLTQKEREGLSVQDPESIIKFKSLLETASLKYISITQQVRDKLKNYVKTHKAAGEKGKALLDTFQNMRRLLDIDEKSFKEEIKNITYNIGAETQELKAILEGGNWQSILSVSRSLYGAKMITFSTAEGNGMSGTTSKFEYRGKAYFRKSDTDGGGYGSPMNSVGTFRIASFFGSDSMYMSAYRMRERSTENVNESKVAGKTVYSQDDYGIILEKAKGMTLQTLNNRNIPVEYSNEAKNMLSRIYIIDFLCGQVDRKSDNIFMDAELRKDVRGQEYWYVKSMMAIDSDQSLEHSIGGGIMNEGMIFATSIDHLQYVEKEFADKLLGLDPATFEKTMAYTLVDVTDNDKIKYLASLMKARLIYMQNLIKKKQLEKGDGLYKMPEHTYDLMAPHVTFDQTDRRFNLNGPCNLSLFTSLREKGFDDSKTRVYDHSLE